MVCEVGYNACVVMQLCDCAFFQKPHFTDVQKQSLCFNKKVKSLISRVFKKKKSKVVCSDVPLLATPPPPPPSTTTKTALEESPDSETLVVYNSNAMHQSCMSPISELKDFEIGYQADVLMQIYDRAFSQKPLLTQLFLELQAYFATSH